MKKTNNEYTKTLTSSIENAKEFYATKTEYAKTINAIISGSKVSKEIDGKAAVYSIVLTADFDSSIAIAFEKEGVEGTPIDNIVDMFYKKVISSGSFNYNFIDNFLDFLTSFAAPYLYSEFVNRDAHKCVKYQIPEIAIIDSIDDINCNNGGLFDYYMAHVKDIKEGKNPNIDPLLGNVPQLYSFGGVLPPSLSPFSAFGQFPLMEQYSQNPTEWYKQQLLKVNGFMKPGIDWTKQQSSTADTKPGI